MLLRQLRYFATVSKEGSVIGALAKLYDLVMTQFANIGLVPRAGGVPATARRYDDSLTCSALERAIMASMLQTGAPAATKYR